MPHNRVMTKQVANIKLKLAYHILSLVWFSQKAKYRFLRLTALPSCPKCDMVYGV